MRSLALVAFLSQFSLQGVTRCAPAPTSPSPDTPTVEEPVAEDVVETKSLARDVDYAAAGDFSFTTTDELIVELPTGRQVKVSLFEPNAGRVTAACDCIARFSVGPRLLPELRRTSRLMGIYRCHPELQWSCFGAI